MYSQIVYLILIINLISINAYWETMKKRMNARARIQIYFDIIRAIQEELTNGDVKPTRIQFKSNLSYGSLLQHLKELEKLKMISREPILLTEKGKSFVQDYSKVTYYFNYAGSKVQRTSKKVSRNVTIRKNRN